MDFLTELVNTGENLLKKVSWLVDREQKATRLIVEKLGEIETRSDHLTAGYHSLYAFCTIALGYSESAAMRRIKAARCVRRYPKALASFREGKLNLSTIGVLSDVLNSSNADELLENAAGKSTAEVRELVAKHLPLPSYNMRDQVAPVFVPRSMQQPELAFDSSLPEVKTEPEEKSYFQLLAEKLYAPRPLKAHEVLEKRLKISFSASPDFSDKLDRMRQLLSGKYLRGACLEEIFSEAMDCYIRHNCPVEKARRSLARKERMKERAKERTAANSDSRRIPAEIRHEVLVRDGFCCTYVSPDGRRCESREKIQIDHIIPYAAGGTHEAENLRCLCAAHNRLVAEQYFGKAHMDQFRSVA